MWFCIRPYTRPFCCPHMRCVRCPYMRWYAARICDFRIFARICDGCPHMRCVRCPYMRRVRCPYMRRVRCPARICVVYAAPTRTHICPYMLPPYAALYAARICDMYAPPRCLYMLPSHMRRVLCPCDSMVECVQRASLVLWTRHTCGLDDSHPRAQSFDASSSSSSSCPAASTVLSTQLPRMMHFPLQLVLLGQGHLRTTALTHS